MMKIRVLVAGILLVVGTSLPANAQGLPQRAGESKAVAQADSPPRATIGAAPSLDADQIRHGGSQNLPSPTTTPSPVAAGPAFALLTPVGDGGSAIFSGGGFAPSETVTFLLGQVDPFTGTLSHPLLTASGIADQQGQVSIPRRFLLPPGIAAGLYSVEATGRSSARRATTGLSLPFLVLSSDLHCPTDPLLPGQSFTAFPAAAAAPFAGGTSIQGTIGFPSLQLGMAAVDAGGNFALPLSVPIGTPDGTYPLIVGGVLGGNALQEQLRSCTITVGAGDGTPIATPAISPTSTPDFPPTDTSPAEVTGTDTPPAAVTGTDMPTATVTGTDTPIPFSVSLMADSTFVAVGFPVHLTATSNRAPLTGYSITIVDLETGSTLATCALGTPCTASPIFFSPTTRDYYATISQGFGFGTVATSQIVTVTWYKPDATPTATATLTATATPTATAAPPPAPPVALIVHGTRLKARPNEALVDTIVGSLTDGSPDSAASFRASIDWGDATIPGLAGASMSGGLRTASRQAPHDGKVTQLYLITGSHTYRQAGTFPINVTISSADGRVAYLTSIAHVNR